MKIIFLVLLAVSCSSHEPKGTAAGAATSPAKKETPKEAPQKSPYTVGECACMKIYMPVCGSDGRTYGNSCEAECNKVTWKDGDCKK